MSAQVPPTIYVNGANFQRNVGKTVRLVGSVSQISSAGGMAQVETGDGHFINVVRARDSLPYGTNYVSIVGTIQDAGTLSEASYEEFGNSFNLRNFNKVVEYSRLFPTLFQPAKVLQRGKLFIAPVDLESTVKRPPYSYLAYTILKRLLAEEWSDVKLHMYPFSLPKVIGRSGNIPPGSIPNKALYLQKDLIRTSRIYSIPFRPPAKFLTADTTTANLLIVAMINDGLPGKQILMVIDAIWAEFFQKANSEIFQVGLSNFGRSQLCKLLDSYLNGDELAHIVELMQTDAVLSQYKNNTKIAIDRGAFGAPIMLVTNGEGKTELFFGSDRFHHIASFLGKDPAVTFGHLVRSHI